MANEVEIPFTGLKVRLRKTPLQKRLEKVEKAAKIAEKDREAKKGQRGSKKNG